MLDQLDLTLNIKKSECKNLIQPLGYRLMELQRLCRQAELPVVVVFEGWDASGKGLNINRLMQCMDPRGFKVHFIHVLSRDEKLRPFLWRYAIRLPHRGFMAIFDRSWYGRLLEDRVESKVPEPVWREAYHEIENFERHLLDDQFILVKFWLHISKKEQLKRFKRMEREPTEAWKVTPDDWLQHRKYDEYILAVEDMLTETSTPQAPWTLVEAENKYFARVKIFETLIRSMEQSLAAHEKKQSLLKLPSKQPDENRFRTEWMSGGSFLRRFDLTKKIPRDEYEEKLDSYQKKIRKLHHRMYLDRVAAVVVFQGWDAAGKGGAIKRLLEPLDPRGFEVITISAPTPVEKSHHYLWRFWKELPKAGHLTIFDRSWYGRILVERVEGFCLTDEWQRAYREINEFEKMLTNAGIVLIKFWLQIDKDEQLRRFHDREQTPYKQWKITSEDWRNRERWDDYEIAVADMIQKTSTTYAPWTVVESNDKLYSRIKVIETFVNTMESILDDSRPRPPLDMGSD